MIIYNPANQPLLLKRIKAAEELLQLIPVKHCFISGSFLYKENYGDIDVFVISRTKKKIEIKNKKVNLTMLDFNQLHSLFYHSIAKSCIAKNILPQKTLKATMSDYWQVINEAVPTVLNHKTNFKKDIRFLVLYMEYFRTGKVLDTFELSQKIEAFKNYKEVMKYIKDSVPKIISQHRKKSYLKRYFYTQASYYKDVTGYDAQAVLYELAHQIVGEAHG